MQKRVALCSSLLVMAVVSPALAYNTFQENVPNGKSVPHPCKANYRWPGLGHINPKGAGERNVFGLAFAEAGFWWSEELCWADSDGDGRTNGEELGDPNCTWTQGTTPAVLKGITHPGICDPFDSEECMKKNPEVDCTVEEFKDCPRLSEPGVMELDLVFTETHVPPTETNYFCMTYDLPNDQDYHIVANEELVDNVDVMHHMLLYGCDDANSEPISSPEACGMSAETGGCNTILGLWAVGRSGSCFPNNTGFRIGQTAFTRVRLEMHWNNPMLRDDYTDASGMRLYIKPASPEVQDMATFTVGQRILYIPPGQSRVEQYGMCQGYCTQGLAVQSFKISSVINHMHYLGSSMKVEVYRDGDLIKTLSNDEYYSYDSPFEHIHDPPFEMMPGDEIKTTCVFNSLSSGRYVYYGDGTSDEMCYSFMNVYPKSALPFGSSCITWGPLSSCDLYAGTPIGVCDWATFLNFKHPESLQIFAELTKNCNMDGFCRPECLSLTEKLLEHPCLQGEAGVVVKFFLESSHEGAQFLSRLYSCHSTSMDTKPDMNCDEYCEASRPPCKGEDRPDYRPDGPDNGTNGATGNLLAATFVLLISFFAFLI